MSSSAKTIATNTIVMYVRMFFLIIISFVSSRYLLKTLGVEDFGIYSVVGSVAATFVSLKSLFSESIQRFLNFEKGTGSLQRQKAVYSISVIIHVILAVVFVVLVELIGLWLINNKLVIPDDKLDTALFVFHLSVAALVFGILSIPFDALVIANERMTFYAVVSIVDGILKLIIILLIPYFPFEYLRTYAVLMAVIPFITLLWLFWYSKSNFVECRFVNNRDKELLSNIFSLSGWNFFGNLSFSLLHEGVNFLLNTFGGLVLNAARSIAYQVRGVAVQFNNNTLVAIRPSIMQSAAVSTPAKLFEKIILISRISFFGMLILIIPIIVYSDELLSIWLVDVPEYSGLFTQLVLLAVLIRSLHEPLNILFMSVGKIKRMMIIETSIMLMSLLVSYIALKFGLGVLSVFVVLILMEIIIIYGLIINAKIELGLSINNYFKQVVIPLLKIIVMIIPAVIVGLLFLQFDSVFLTILFCGLYIVLTIGLVYINMTEQEKSLLHKIIKRNS